MYKYIVKHARIHTGNYPVTFIWGIMPPLMLRWMRQLSQLSDSPPLDELQVFILHVYVYTLYMYTYRYIYKTRPPLMSCRSLW